MNIQKPKGWRTGQTMFNFLEWLLQNGHVMANQNSRMGDPFHLSDKEWDELYEKFMEEVR